MQCLNFSLIDVTTEELSDLSSWFQRPQACTTSRLNKGPCRRSCSYFKQRGDLIIKVTRKVTQVVTTEDLLNKPDEKLEKAKKANIQIVNEGWLRGKVIMTAD